MEWVIISKDELLVLANYILDHFGGTKELESVRLLIDTTDGEVYVEWEKYGERDNKMILQLEEPPI